MKQYYFINLDISDTENLSNIRWLMIKTLKKKVQILTIKTVIKLNANFNRHIFSSFEQGSSPGTFVDVESVRWSVFDSIFVH